MELTQLLDDDSAVSPVIGVILMVAITVILAAIIGTFTLGLGDQVKTSPPRASFGFDTGTETLDDFNTGNTTQVSTVTVTHESGDTIQASNLEVTVNGKAAYGVTDAPSDGVSKNVNLTKLWESGDVSGGSSVTIIAATNNDSITEEFVYGFPTQDSETFNIVDATGADPYIFVADVGIESGETVRVTYDDPNSDNTATLAKYEIP